MISDIIKLDCLSEKEILIIVREAELMNIKDFNPFYAFFVVESYALFHIQSSYNSIKQIWKTCFEEEN